MDDRGKRSLVSCLSTFSNDFSETTELISINFHMQPPRKGGKKVNIFALGHIPKLAASREPLSRLP